MPRTSTLKQYRTSMLQVCTVGEGRPKVKVACQKNEHKWMDAYVRKKEAVGTTGISKLRELFTPSVPIIFMRTN